MRCGLMTDSLCQQSRYVLLAFKALNVNVFVDGPSACVREADALIIMALISSTPRPCQRAYISLWSWERTLERRASHIITAVAGFGRRWDTRWRGPGQIGHVGCVERHHRGKSGLFRVCCWCFICMAPAVAQSVFVSVLI